MAKTRLSEQEAQTVIECLNNQTEVPPELLEKLSPSFFARLAEESQFDYEKLDKARIPTIEYAGKRSETQILNQATLMGGNAPLEIERCFDGEKQEKGIKQVDLIEQAEASEPDNGNWKNLIVQGDNLQFLKTCYLNQNPLIKDRVKGKVKLIYIDPPFATKSDFSGGNGESSYSDKVDRAEFLESLRERLIFMREILADDGSIYVHLDYRTSHYVKTILDEIFGKNRFINELIWVYEGREMAKNNYNRKHENILFYTKSSTYIFNEDSILDPLKESSKKAMSRFTDEDGKAYVLRYKEGGGFAPKDKENSDEVYRQYVPEGVPPRDWFKLDYSRKGERYNYPTQKPETLLERLISISSASNDLILDVFAGSGTTAAVAEKLGRRWITCDFGKHAIYTMQKRMLEIANSKALGEDADGDYGKPPKPFCVVSVGAYDFSKIMNLRENKDIYIQFVCGLFNIGEVSADLSEKYHLANIYAEKDGDPVEVYPVWEDEYLKEVKVDESYLRGIIQQSGGKLEGTYYIITPETCTVVGDTEIENDRGGRVNFKLLKFPYKVLEEFARKQQLQEQPSSEGDINNLIDSVGFYFNERVEAELEKTDEGLKITHFETEALDGDGNKFEGLDGLAMVLVDKDYDGEIFTMEEAVYQKDINEDGSFEVGDLTNKVGVIVVDKHGNESNLVVLEG